MTNRERHLHLDLEETIITPVINGWLNVQLMNVLKIKAFIEEFKPDFVHVFSFAIWDEHDKKGFAMGPQPMLEKALGITISNVPTTQEIIRACANVMKIDHSSLSFSDLCDFWGKHQAFRLNVRHSRTDVSTPIEVALLDDVVNNELFEWPDLNVKGRIINIQQSLSWCKNDS